MFFIAKNDNTYQTYGRAKNLYEIKIAPLSSFSLHSQQKYWQAFGEYIYYCDFEFFKYLKEKACRGTVNISAKNAFNCMFIENLTDDIQALLKLNGMNLVATFKQILDDDILDRLCKD